MGMSNSLGIYGAFAACAALFLWDEFFGFLFLVGGLCLANRSFAYIHLNVGAVPLYLPEFALSCWTLRAACSRPSLLQRLRDLPSAPRKTWCLFMGWGLIALFRGLAHYSVIVTLRDSALVYYATMLLLASGLPITENRAMRARWLLGGMLFVHALIVWMKTLTHLPPDLTACYGQGAGSSLAMAIGLLWNLSTLDLRLRSVANSAWMIFLSTALLMEQVRSSWTALAVGLVLLVFLLSRRLPLKPLLQRMLSTGFVLATGSLVCLLLIPSLTRMVGRMHMATNVAQESLPPALVRLQNPVAVGSPVSSAQPRNDGAQALRRPTPILSPSPTVNHVSTTACPTHPSEPPVDQVYDEFMSMTKGTDSKNVLTRLWMWRDAVYEVFSTGLFSNALRIQDLKKYVLPRMKLSPNDTEIIIQPSGAGLESVQQVLPLVPEGEQPDNGVAFQVRRWTKILFGLGFGKLFLPPEVVYWLDSANRYDPHNSFVAILYRMGLTGLITLFVLLYLTFQNLRRAMAMPGVAMWQLLMLTAVETSIAYVIVHSLTDNTLENGFKGPFFWIFLGLAYHRRLRPATQQVA